MTITTDTPAAPAGRKDWQGAHHAPDRAKTIAMAMGSRLLGHHVTACAAEDMQILGLRQMPEPRPWMWPVTAGTDEERMARVDAWAARHGIRAYSDEAAGQYKATLTFGPVELTVYTITDADLAARLAARMAAIQAQADETLAVTQPERAL